MIQIEPNDGNHLQKGYECWGYYCNRVAARESFLTPIWVSVAKQLMLILCFKR